MREKRHTEPLCSQRIYEARQLIKDMCVRTRHWTRRREQQTQKLQRLTCGLRRPANTAATSTLWAVTSLPPGHRLVSRD